MKEWSIATHRGNFTVTETLLWYDGPQLIALRDAGGESYLGYQMDWDDDTAVWLLVPVAPERIAAVRAGTLSLRQAVLADRNAIALEVTVPRDGTAGRSRERRVADLPAEDLPQDTGSRA